MGSLDENNPDGTEDIVDLSNGMEYTVQAVLSALGSDPRLSAECTIVIPQSPIHMANPYYWMVDIQGKDARSYRLTALLTDGFLKAVFERAFGEYASFGKIGNA